MFRRHHGQSILKSMAVIRSSVTRVTPIKLGGGGRSTPSLPRPVTFGRDDENGLIIDAICLNLSILLKGVALIGAALKAESERRKKL